MRVIETIHPNTQCRTFTCDQIISKVYITDRSHLYDKSKPDPEAQKLFDSIQDIPLLDNDVTVDKYSIRIKIEDAFEDNEKDWSDIRQAVFYCLANFFKLDIIEIESAHSIKDDRKRFSDPVVDIGAIYDVVSKIKIPHDFETHRVVWRGAIESQLEEAKDLVLSPKTSGFEKDVTYWQNELDKFDAAFDALLALKLPQS